MIVFRRLRGQMFTSRRLGLFDGITCPDITSCSRNPCLFSHKRELSGDGPIKDPPTLSTASTSGSSGSPAIKPILKPILKLSHSSSSSEPSSSIPAKRPMLASPLTASPILSPANEPPRKLLRVGRLKAVAVNFASSSKSTEEPSVPILSVPPGTSKVPIATRQQCLMLLYHAFVDLYAKFNNAFPHLARDHALAQESETHTKTNKLTYRQGIVSALVAIKKRQVPPSPDHDSVGTDSDIRAREKARKIKVGAADLEEIVLSREKLIEWGYMVDIPEGPGGDLPTSESAELQCERCLQNFCVTAMGDGADDACTYHWAKAFNTTTNGEKFRAHRCCSMQVGSKGCTQGPHVFSEKVPEELHRRHPFSSSSEPAPTLGEDVVLEVAALDCEMIYTTGGLQLARVSLVDGEGKQVFDEFVRMPEGVKVIDYITRWSGITPELLQSAVLDLTGIRQALRSFIGSKTILIGHALDNDLKSLRMVHHRVVDTSVLFPHKAGAPFRRALRDLASEKLQMMIQSGGESGHSSVEDAKATLDLVRWWILHEKKPKKTRSRGKKRSPSPPSSPPPSKQAKRH